MLRNAISASTLLFLTFYKMPYCVRAERIWRQPGCLHWQTLVPIRLLTLARYGVKSFMSASKAFFDTNVLLYMYSGENGSRRERSKALFRQHARAKSILLSTQVVQEFYAAGSRKLRLPARGLKDAVSDLLDLPLVSIGTTHIMEAIQLEERYRISFWDSLILAAAESGGAQLLYTEDLNDGQRYGSVLVENPFRGTAPPHVR